MGPIRGDHGVAPAASGGHAADTGTAEPPAHARPGRGPG